jgi:hypothetical protein
MEKEQIINPKRNYKISQIKTDLISPMRSNCKCTKMREGKLKSEAKIKKKEVI